MNENLAHAQDFSKLQAVKQIIGDRNMALTEFDDALFEAMVEKVIIYSPTEYEFIFESGQRIKAIAGK